MGDIKCMGKLGKWFGHKYQARYSLSAGSGLKLDGVISAYQLQVLTDASRDKTYHHDICVRCGHVIKKESDTN